MYIHFLLTLQILSGFGYRSIKRLLEQKVEPQNLTDLWKQVSLSHKTIRYEDIKISLEKAERIIRYCQKTNIFILDQSHQFYPKHLLHISSPPHLLFAKGNLERLNDKRTVAFIGSRNPTNYAKTIGKQIIKTLVQEGSSIISGLALGCDTIGHKECLANGGKTLAVLPSGVENVYPKSNVQLSKQMIENDGCLISEYEPFALALKNRFIERDRLQSGLSNKVIVLETDLRSGTMHTVKFAIEQNRPIAVVASHPSIDMQKEELQGSVYLIENKLAVPLKDKKELLSFLFEPTDRIYNQ
jgi:DNA processing protein